METKEAKIPHVLGCCVCGKKSQMSRGFLTFKEEHELKHVFEGATSGDLCSACMGKVNKKRRLDKDKTVSQLTK